MSIIWWVYYFLSHCMNLMGKMNENVFGLWSIHGIAKTWHILGMKKPQEISPINW